MNLDDALKNNPYDPKRGNISAYIRYLRYNVDGWYYKQSKDVRVILYNLGIKESAK